MNKNLLYLFKLLFVFISLTQTTGASSIDSIFDKQITNDKIKSISMSQDGENIAIASEDNYIHFFDKNGARIWNLKIYDGMVREVATNGMNIAAGISYSTSLNSKSIDRGRVRLYSNSRNIIFDKVIEPEDSNFSSTVQHVAISSDGSIIVASDKNRVYILDKTGNILRNLPINESVTDVAISPNKKLGAISFGDTISLFDIYGRIFMNLKLENTSINGISISDDEYIAILTQQKIFLYKNDLKLWEKNADTGNYYTSVSISSVNDLIAVTSTRDGLFLYDKNGVEIIQHPIDFNYVSTDGRLIAGVKNTFLYLFNITQYTNGSISILSTHGAEVYLDEKLAGNVPITISNVPVGMHTIKISKTGYESWIQNINLSYGDKKEISIMLAPYISIPTSAPTHSPVSTSDVIMISKNSLFFILYGGIIIVIPGIIYLIKRKFERSIPSNAVQDASSVKIYAKNEPFVGGNCPYCGDLIKANSRIIICQDCQTPHHQECWTKHGGCTTFGCNKLLKPKCGLSTR